MNKIIKNKKKFINIGYEKANNQLNLIKKMIKIEKPLIIWQKEKYFDINNNIYSEEDKRFQLLIFLILGIQTNNKVLDKVYNELFNLKDFNKISYSQMNLENLEFRIKTVNFYKNKAKYILNIAKEFKYKTLPTNIKELLKIKGIGKQIAIMYMEVALNKIEGISVNSHVNRISNILDWVNNTDSNTMGKDLENLFPKKEWLNIHHLLVGFGQTICLKKNPKCFQCLLNNDCKIRLKMNKLMSK